MNVLLRRILIPFTVFVAGLVSKPVHGQNVVPQKVTCIADARVIVWRSADLSKFVRYRQFVATNASVGASFSSLNASNYAQPFPTELSHSSSLQDQNGFSALKVDFQDDAASESEWNDADVNWDGIFKNVSGTPQALTFTFEIKPGHVQIEDATLNGLGTNDLHAWAYFGIAAFISSSSSAAFTNVWSWFAEVEGGRQELVLNRSPFNYGFTIVDKQGVGFPPISSGWSGSQFTESWPTFTRTLNLGMIPPGGYGGIRYGIEISANGTGTDNSGQNGANSMGGDPFTVGTGDPDGVGSSLKVVAGDFVLDVPGPSRLALQPITSTSRQLQLKGLAGRTYAIQGSSNLVNWTTLLTTNPLAMPFLWTDPDQGNFTRYFYRAQLLP